jgi:hypothetical protein
MVNDFARVRPFSLEGASTQGMGSPNPQRAIKINASWNAVSQEYWTFNSLIANLSRYAIKVSY